MKWHKRIPWDCQFLASNQEHLFRAYARSFHSNDKSLLICNALGEEAKSSFAVLEQFCQSVWELGWSVARFDYRGTGDSTGSFEQTDPERWCQDAGLVLNDFISFTDAEQVVLMGVRLGCNIAVQLPDYLPPNRSCMGYILWEPVLDLKKHLRHLQWIARKSNELDGIDYFGWQYTSTCLDQIVKDLEIKRDDIKHPAWIANISGRSKLAKEFETIHTWLTGSSELKHIRSRPFWELIGQSRCDEVIEASINWLPRLPAQ